MAPGSGTPPATAVIVGMSTCNLAAGAGEVYELCRRWIEGRAPGVALRRTGCLGMCYCEPQVQVVGEDGTRALYIHVDPGRMERILEEHVAGGTPVPEWLAPADRGEAHEFLRKQRRLVLEHCGRIDPEAIDDYLAVGGYQALEQVLEAGDPEAVIEEITRAGLRGRGGAGFPTGLKWRFARRETGPKKYVICNADEGDPGAFMDRTILESVPHAVLEGMAIGAFATGADEGVVYCRAEYPLAVRRLRTAIAQAEERGLLGEGIRGTAFRFRIRVKEGAGAFVCGEETALIASVEGRRGMPRIRPPFPAQRGLHGKPTTINNVETWANVPWIVRRGAEAFAQLGTDKSKGTKVFALAGKVKRGGLVEVPMGIRLSEIIYDIGGGTPDDRPVLAVQMGGPSGGCVPASLLGTRVDYEEVSRTGAIMGSGGMVVLDETSCMVDVARYFLDFVQNESCGKCTFCRIGTKRMLETLTRICEGEGRPSDPQELHDLAWQVKTTSLCGLGQTAPNPVLTTLRHFREVYRQHIEDGECRAGKCRNLCAFEITDSCTGCRACVAACPVDAVSGERRARHAIDPELCIRCGACRDACPFDAVAVRPARRGSHP
ncbi:MAG: NADH-quinone oxidoreductase subunit NuoF [Deferrisomatales bacterium]